MRCAVIVSPWDPRSSDAGAWSDSVAWLGAALGRLGFRVAVVDGAADVQGDLARALMASASADDDVLVHVSGHLARRGVLRAPDGGWLPLRALGETLAAHRTGNVSLFAELVHDDDADDALVAADHVASAVSALGARERGYGAVAAVRPGSAPIEGLAFTKLVLAVAEQMTDGAQLSGAYERATAMPEALAAAQSFTLVRGRSELDLVLPPPPPADLDAQIDAATADKDWTRVVALRRERLGAAGASVRQRGKELVAIARVLQAELADADGAIDALEQARAIEPRRVPVLQALKRGYEIQGRWASAIEVAGALADL